MSVTTMCIGRLVSGLSIGLLSPVVSLYQSEAAQGGTGPFMHRLSHIPILFSVAIACFRAFSALPSHILSSADPCVCA